PRRSRLPRVRRRRPGRRPANPLAGRHRLHLGGDAPVRGLSPRRQRMRRRLCRLDRYLPAQARGPRYGHRRTATQSADHRRRVDRGQRPTRHQEGLIMAGFGPPDGTLAVTTDTFDKAVLAATRPVLVEFGAAWCPPCRVIGPVLSALAADRAADFDVAVLDADSSPEIPARYGVLGLPTMILFSGGSPVMQVVGARSRTRLEAEIDAALTPVG